MTSETFSILMPAYNAEAYISDAIESVIAQTYTNWELIICDDNSSDRTVNIIETYIAKDPRISCISNHHQKGAPGARNSALDKANGRFIAFLDADDLWYPNKLELQVKEFESGESIVFSYTDTMSVSGIKNGSIRAPHKVSYAKMLFNNFMPCLTVAYDCKALGKIHQPNIKKRNDYALWLRLLKERSSYAKCIPKSLASYRLGTGGLSSSFLDNIAYYIRCIKLFETSNLKIYFYLFPVYLIIMFIKKSSLRFFNSIVVLL